MINDELKNQTMEKRITIVALTCALIIMSWVVFHRPGIANPALRRHFIDRLLPKIEKANHAIEIQRNHLLALYRTKPPLSSIQTLWLTSLAQRYKMPVFDSKKASNWQTLIDHVNTIPPSLALAQAANESAWGTSYFAQQANNYFGQWCYKKGCGIIPQNRNPKDNHEIKRFDSLYHSIESYMHNLNSHPGYEKFRQLRAQLTNEKKTLKGSVLAEKLQAYNPHPEAYISKIKALIEQYDLEQYDQ